MDTPKVTSGDNRTASEAGDDPRRARMVLTCGVCGHRGEDGTTYNHACYLVFRERGRGL